MNPIKTSQLATGLVAACLAFTGLANAATVDMTETTQSEDRLFQTPNCVIDAIACDGLLTVNTTTKVTTITAIESVLVQGFGTFTFPDFGTAPDLSDTQSAFAAAASALGVPSGSIAESLTLIALPERSQTDEKRSFNSSDDAVFVGAPEDPVDSFVILQGSLTVDVFLTTRLERRFQLQATLGGTPPPATGPTPTPIPLPATAPLLLIGLAGLTAIRRQTRHAGR